MNMSDSIEKLLLDMLREAGGNVEIQRNTLAGELNCVPSQINYVIQTRFTPERGYTIESRRGGGGGIRIRCVTADRSTYPMHIVNAVGETLSRQTAYVFIRNLIDYECITKREGRLMAGALSDNVLPFEGGAARDKMRASIFKNMLTSLYGS